MKRHRYKAEWGNWFEETQMCPCFVTDGAPFTGKWERERDGRLRINEITLCVHSFCMATHFITTPHRKKNKRCPNNDFPRSYAVNGKERDIPPAPERPIKPQLGDTQPIGNWYSFHLALKKKRYTRLHRWYVRKRLSLDSLAPAQMIDHI